MSYCSESKAWSLDLRVDKLGSRFRFFILSYSMFSGLLG